MHLEIETSLPINKNGNFWSITGVLLNILDNATTISYALWTNQQAYIDKEDAKCIYQVKIEREENTAINSQLGTVGVTPVGLAYQYIKANVKHPIDFSGAIIVP